jgi:uncharacterized protein DUF4258
VGQRFIARETIIAAAESYEVVEAYPDDKYFPSYLLLGRQGEEHFMRCSGLIWTDRTCGSLPCTIPALKSGKKI